MSAEACFLCTGETGVSLWPRTPLSRPQNVSENQSDERLILDRRLIISMTSMPNLSIPVYTRELSRIALGLTSSVTYHPARGNGHQKGRSGTITSVDTLSDGRTRFIFYDDTYERDIEVTIGETVGQCDVRSRKDERWITLGKPLRVEVGQAGDEYEDLILKSVEEAFEGRYPSIVAIPAIKWNERILEWFEWSSRHA